jgi:MoaA/NifB/PqqE/SkfB family radical SAM enzyme
MVRTIAPTNLSVEACTVCQLRCPTCPTTSEDANPFIGQGSLRAGDFERLLAGAPRARAVHFVSLGEIFLNKEIGDVLRIGHERGLDLHSDSGTNFNHAPEELLEALVRYRLRELRCSIDGASPETYGRYRVGGDFDRVIDNLRRLDATKRRLGGPYPRLIWQFVVFGHNEHELPKARAMAHDLGMAFEAKMSWDPAYSPIRDAAFVREQTGWKETSRDDFVDATGQNYMRDVCRALWLYPRVNWDGRMLGCCWNSWGEFGGNAFEDGYEAVVDSAGLRRAREMLLGRSGPTEAVPCTTCEMYLGMCERGDFLTEDEIFGPTSRFRRALQQVHRRGPGRRARTHLVLDAAWYRKRYFGHRPR